MTQRESHFLVDLAKGEKKKKEKKRKKVDSFQDAVDFV